MDAISKNRMISVHFQGKPFNIMVIQVCAPTSNAEEAEVEWIYEDLQDLLAPAAAKSLQSFPTLCDPTDCSPPGFAIPGTLQARTLEWVAISFSKAWKWKVKVKSLSRVQLFTTPWTAAYQVPPSMGFSRREYWSGLPLPSPTRPSRTNTKKIKDVLFITGDWNAKVGSQEIPGVTGKFGLGVQNEAGQRLTEFC